MASSSNISWATILLVLAIGMVKLEGLSPDYYSSSCPNVLSTVKAVVAEAVQKQARMGASLLRLHFHDCFVNSCDGSLLLDDNTTFTGEKTAPPNNNSVWGFEVVDDIKTAVEKVCPGVVSCADILAIAARDSTVALGGPSWEVLLGRRDSTTANMTAAAIDLPGFSSNISALVSNFANQGLPVKRPRMWLGGSHTIGQARCTTFRDRIYNDTNINSTFAAELQSNCTRVGNDDSLAGLDAVTPNQFDNYYFTILLSEKGLLHSDQALTDSSSPSTISLVEEYVNNSSTFFEDFGTSMINMRNISPLTGTEGEIRTNCRKAN